MSAIRTVVLLAVAVAVAAAVPGCARTESAPAPAPPPDRAPVTPVVATDPVTDDADDPAIWVHPADPGRSVVFGTNKVAAPAGAVVAFGLDGRVRQTVAGLDRPNNIDVEYGVRADGRRIDVAVVTERLRHRLRIFEIEPADGRLREIGVVPVLDGEAGDRSEPMGISLYKRAADEALFAVVAPKSGGALGYLAQYRLHDDGRGGVTGTFVRRFGAFSETRTADGELGEIEAVVVDDVPGYVYYSDELHGIRKWHADPDHPDADRELAVFGRDGYRADREGLAIYASGDRTGYVVSTDQIEAGSVLKFYRREGTPGAPHDHGTPAFEVLTTADSTDGIDVARTPLPGFPGGLVAMMNSSGRNFLFFRADTLLAAAPR